MVWLSSQPGLDVVSHFRKHALYVWAVTAGMIRFTVFRCLMYGKGPAGLMAVGGIWWEMVQ